jgi:hypothetical protein
MCRFSLLAFSSATLAGFWDRTTRKLSRKKSPQLASVIPEIQLTASVFPGWTAKRRELQIAIK